MSSPFDKIVFKWVNDALPDQFPGLVIVRAEQNGPRPNTDYVTFKVLDWTESDFDGFDKTEQGPETEFIDVLHYNRNRVTVSVNAYSEDGREMLTRLSKSKKKWEIRRELENGKVSHIRTGQVRDLTFLGDTRYRRRFQVDFIFLVWTDYLEVRPKVTEITANGNIRSDENEV